MKAIAPGKEHKYESIDLAKFIGSILVFSMHCSALKDFGKVNFLLEISARWVVPFFFLASSYFLFSKSVDGNISKTDLCHYIKRIISLYFLWFIFNLPNVIIGYDLIHINAWPNFIKNFLLSSSFTGSWFLASSMFSAWFVYVLSKKERTEIIVFISFGFYLICIIMSVYRGILPVQIDALLSFFCFPLNIFCGCFYFALGKLIYENKLIILKYFTIRKLLLIFIVSYLLYYLEVQFAIRLSIYSRTDAAFFIIPAATSLFLICIKATVRVKNHLTLRKLSTIIYCCQGNILTARYTIHGSLCNCAYATAHAYAIAVFAVAVVSVAVLLLQKKTSWRWVKNLT